MEFSYYKVIDFPKHQKRNRLLPWIYVGIFNPKNDTKLVYPLGLIDTGSDLTIINYELGEELGFDIESGKEQKIVGLGGSYITGYLHLLGFKISDLKEKEKPIIYQDYAVFTYRNFPKSLPQQTAILGTMGFIRHLAITFEYPECIFIKAKEPSMINVVSSQ